MSRRFDGVDDEFRFPVTGASSSHPPMTLLEVIRRRAVTGFRAGIGVVNSAGTSHIYDMEWNGQTYLWEVNESGSVSVTFDGTSGRPPATNTTDWIVVCYTKPTGTSAARMHYKNLTTGSAWIHINTATTIANSANALTGGSWRIGEWRDNDDADKNLAIDAGWMVELTDLQIEGLFANNRTQDFLDLHATVPGAWLHQHNQAVETDDIIDLFGNGHDATGTISGTTTTSGIQGTSMDTSTDPPGWTYYSAGPPPAIMHSYQPAMSLMKPTTKGYL